MASEPRTIPARRFPPLGLEVSPPRQTLPAPSLDDDFGGHDLLDYVRILTRRKKLVIFMTILGLLGGMAATLPQVPLYLSRTTIEFMTPNDSINIQQLDGVNSADYQIDSYIQTQIKILQSRAMLTSVIGTMNRTERKDAVQPESQMAKLLANTRIHWPQQRLSWPEYVETTASSLSLRTVPATRIVELSAVSPDPELAADFLNTLVQMYSDADLRSRQESSERTTAWLNDQLQELRAKLKGSAEQLHEYSSVSGFLNTPGQETAAQERLRTLQNQLLAAQADRVKSQSEFEVSSRPAGENEGPRVANDSTRLKDYEQRLSDLRGQLTELNPIYTPEHPRIRRLNAQIAEVQAAMARERQALLQSMKSDYDIAMTRERLLAAATTAQEQRVAEELWKSTQFGLLKRDVDTDQQIYDALLQKLKEASVANTLRNRTVRVVDDALPAGGPYRPNMMLNSAMGLAVGLLGGVFFAFVMERFDRNLKSPEEVTFYLGLPELGVIPPAQEARPVRMANSLGLLGPAHERPAMGDAEGAMFAQSFRGVLASVLFGMNGSTRPQVIVIASPRPKEGKSAVAANLGLALAEIGRRVILIDADVRKPVLHRTFGVPNTWGLSDLLSESLPLNDIPLEALLKPTRFPKLLLLPSGPITANAANLAFSPRMADLVARFRRDADVVIIDTPPVLQFPDARILAKLADAAILVVRARQTDRDAARIAKERFLQDETPILGTILNDCPIPGDKYYYPRGTKA